MKTPRMTRSLCMPYTSPWTLGHIGFNLYHKLRDACLNAGILDNIENNTGSLYVVYPIHIFVKIGILNKTRAHMVYPMPYLHETWHSK